MQMLLRTRPENLEDLTVEVALVRPGPIQGGAVHPYLQRREAVRADPAYRVPHDHPLLAEALADTLGVIVYQDQVLDVAVALAGFSQGQAESLRRAMSRRRSREAMVAHWRAFRDGARGRGVDEPTARRVFEKIVAFSEFGFPKAHAAAFGLLAYQSAWLRRHYPSEFLCALLNEQPMGFYPPASLVRDAQRRGVEVRGADVNASLALCSIEPESAVRIGLSYVRGLGQPAALGLVEAREQDGPYTDVADLVRRAGLSLPECERIITAGACDAFGPRREQLWRAGLIARPESTRGGRQLALDLELGTTPALPLPGAWDDLVADYETTGLSVRDHPLAQLRAGLTARGFVTTAALEHIESGTPIGIAGLTVARQRPASAKGVVFLLLEDEHGLVNLVLFREVYEQHRLLARTEPLLEAIGRLERRERNINVIVERLSPLGTPRAACCRPPGCNRSAARRSSRSYRWRRATRSGGCARARRERITSGADAASASSRPASAPAGSVSSSRASSATCRGARRGSACGSHRSATSTSGRSRRCARPASRRPARRTLPARSPVVGPTTSAASISPATVPDAGHAGVSAGGLGRLLHRKAETPPLIARLPKWMCACWTVPSSPEYVSL